MSKIHKSKFGYFEKSGLSIDDFLNKSPEKILKVLQRKPISKLIAFKEELQKPYNDLCFLYKLGGKQLLAYQDVPEEIVKIEASRTILISTMQKIEDICSIINELVNKK